MMMAVSIMNYEIIIRSIEQCLIKFKSHYAKR